VDKTSITVDILHSIIISVRIDIRFKKKITTLGNLGQIFGLDISKNSNYGNIIKIVTHGDNDENGKNCNWTMSSNPKKKNKKI